MQLMTKTRAAGCCKETNVAPSRACHSHSCHRLCSSWPEQPGTQQQPALTASVPEVPKSESTERDQIAGKMPQGDGPCHKAKGFFPPPLGAPRQCGSHRGKGWIAYLKVQQLRKATNTADSPQFKLPVNSSILAGPLCFQCILKPLHPNCSTVLIKTFCFSLPNNTRCVSHCQLHTCICISPGPK